MNLKEYYKQQIYAILNEEDASPFSGHNGVKSLGFLMTDPAAKSETAKIVSRLQGNSEPTGTPYPEPTTKPIGTPTTPATAPDLLDRNNPNRKKLTPATAPDLLNRNPNSPRITPANAPNLFDRNPNNKKYPNPQI